MENNVWVMIYDSEHGVDFVVASTELVAWRAAAAVCLEMIDDGEYAEDDEFEAAQAACTRIVNQSGPDVPLTIDECKAVIEACAPLGHGRFEIDLRAIVTE